MILIVNVKRKIMNDNFLKNHADTLAIIGVNIAIAAILIMMTLSNMASIDSANSRMDAANARMDTIHVMFYDLLKESRKQ